MSDISVVVSELKAAATATTSAGESASGRGGGEHLTSAAAALPGSTAATHLPDLGATWDDEVDDWSQDVVAFSTDVSEQADDYSTTDHVVGLGFRALWGIFG